MTDAPENRGVALALGGILLHLALSAAPDVPAWARSAPLWAVLAAGGAPLLADIARKTLRRELGSDLLAGIGLAAAALMGYWLVGAILVLMLYGGQAIERLAARRASSALAALAARMPKTAHRRAAGRLQDVALDDISPGDVLVVFPHELCPADGIVREGRGRMDESYLTGEPFEIAKIPGARVLSGAVNGESALTIEARRRPAESRYAGILKTMEEAERARPPMRRLADRLALGYVPLALAVAAGAWASGRDPVRFLAVLAAATPCPLLIAIPVAVVGAVSLCARRGILIRDAGVLERISQCRTVILDKTGTLTAGRPRLSETLPAPGLTAGEILRLAAALERYSRHPLAGAVLRAAEEAGLDLPAVAAVEETPGTGLLGTIAGRRIMITGRKLVAEDVARALPPPAPGLECLVLVDGAFAALLRFRDAARRESAPFLTHLTPRHGVDRILIVSGDREAEVRALADEVGVREIIAGASPEEKVALVAAQTRQAPTLFVGDGINDAPALAAATVGVAVGGRGDVASRAAGAALLTPSLTKLDELLHIGARMRAVALQSAVGGMALSLAAMALAAAGRLTPVEGAVAQELIDLAAVLNALRAARPPRALTDFDRRDP